MEAFKPVEGSVVTLGSDSIISGVRQVTLEARQIKASDGTGAKGLKVDIQEGEYKEGTSFIDADEIGELIRAMDAMLAVNSNPTQFHSFEVHYTTRGSLKLIVFNRSDGSLSYAIEAGIATAFTDAAGFAKLKQGIEEGKQKLDSVPK
jgi:hypothetical protein